MHKTNHIIPYGKHSISEEDIEAVCSILRSDWITQGPSVELFEKAVAEYCGAKYAVAACNGTAALHLACLAAEVGKGKRLWTSPNSFVASANSALYCGAQVDFVDIDPTTYCMSAVCLKEKLELADKNGTLPDVVMPVHFAGQSCEMEEICRLSKLYDFKIIEDACHAIGGDYQGRKIGSCSYSDMAVFSFHPVKIITTGEGGMIVTNSKKVYETLNLLRSHGVTRDPKLMVEETHGPWYYQQIDLGFNYRLTDIQAILGLSQLKKITKFVKKRHQLAERYNKYLSQLPVAVPRQNPDCYSSFHLYVIRLQLENLQKSHLRIFNELRKKGILVNLHYIPIHMQPFYQKQGFKFGQFPEAEQYYKEAISIPMYFNLKDTEQDLIISSLGELII